VSPFNVLVTVLLFCGVAAELVCVLGVVVMRGPFDRLHYAAAGTTLGPVLIGAAIVLRETVQPQGAVEPSSAALQTAVVVVFMFLLNPALTVLTARAARRAEFGSLKPTPAERERGR
jgi:monovalent cation/proton antiporter MnhG/PhaG subunit